MAWHFAFHQVKEIQGKNIGNDVDDYITHLITESWRKDEEPPPETIAPFVAVCSDANTLRSGFI